jgi:hypothetical protein
MKLTPLDETFSLTGIYNGSLIRVLTIPWEEAVRETREGFLIPYLKNIPEKFERIANCYIRAVFETKQTLRSSLMRNGPERSMKQMGHCSWSISWERGRRYVGEIGSGHKGTVSNMLMKKVIE